MELDDFKSAWGKSGQSTITRELLLHKINQLEKSGKKIRRTFVVEVAVISIIYLLFLSVVVFFNEQIQSFIYKLVIIIFIGVSPVYYRLYQCQRWVNAIDYSTDIRSNLIAFLTYYRTTIKWYWLSSLVTSVLIITMFFNDADFLMMVRGWQIGICAYVVSVLLLTRPYLRSFYGKHVKEFESFVKE